MSKFPRIETPEQLESLWQRCFGKKFYVAPVEFRAIATKPVEVYIGENATIPTVRHSGGRVQIPSSFTCSIESADGRIEIVEVCNFDGINPSRGANLPETGRRNEFHSINANRVLDPSNPRERMAIMYLDLAPENVLSPLWWSTKKHPNRNTKGMWDRYKTKEFEFSSQPRSCNFTRVDNVAEESILAEKEFRDDQIIRTVSGLNVKMVDAIFENLVNREIQTPNPRIYPLSENVGNPENVKRLRLKNFALAYFPEFQGEYLRSSTHILKLIQDAFDYGFITADGMKLSFKDKELEFSFDMPTGVADPKDWLWKNLIPNSHEHTQISIAVSQYESNRKRQNPKAPEPKEPEVAATAGGQPPRNR